MICVLTSPRDAGLWQHACSMLRSPCSVASSSADAPLLADARVVLVDGSEPIEVLTLFGACPPVLVHLGLRALNMRSGDKPLYGQYSIVGSTMDRSFKAERYGARSICHKDMTVTKHGSVPKIVLSGLLPTTGPGARSEDGGFVLWRSDDLAGRGVRVSRDEPGVIEAVYRATRGDGPLWVQPGFPFLVPAQPQTFRTLDGGEVTGLLCASSDRAGGWVVLTRRDVLDILGHPGDVPWPYIPSLIGVEAAASLLGWLSTNTASVSWS